MTSKRSPGTAASRSPRRASTRTPLSRALSRTVQTARRETSTAVTDPAPARAAVIATAPEPVHRSSTRPPRSRGSARAAAASSQVSLRGVKTPGSRAMRIMAVPPYPLSQPVTLTAADLRAAFDAPEPLTVGLEEELMLLHPDTLDLLPRAAEVVEAAADARVKVELPAAQLELSLPPAPSVSAAVAGLAAGRRDLAAAAAPFGRLAAAGVHPFASPLGELNPGERYDAHAARVRRDGAAPARVRACRSTWPSAARTAPWPSTTRCARGCPPSPRWPPTPPTTTAATRAWPPSAPSCPSCCRARASRRPSPPGRRSPTRCAGARRPAPCPTPGRWWWELRPHPAYGTLEVRVPDAQATVADAAAVTALVVLPRGLAGRAPRRGRDRAGAGLVAAGGEPLVGGALGARRRARRPRHRRPHAGARDPRRAAGDAAARTPRRWAAPPSWRRSRELMAANGAMRQRRAGGPHAATAWLANAYVPAGDYAAAPAG